MTATDAELSLDVRKIRDNAALFCCPVCEGPFVAYEPDGVRCETGHNFPVANGLPLLFAPHDEYDQPSDVTQRIQQFYSENPFPSYDDFDDVHQLVEKSCRNVYSKALNDAIPFGARVLEVGCGTGQLSIFLSLANRDVFGADLTPQSLALACGFRDKHRLERVCFYQMNLFRPIFREESFDLVYCSGVLHHTTYPYKGFQSISRLVRKNGYIMIGLYNACMRMPTHVRRLLSYMLPIHKMDPVIRKLSTEQKKQVWFNDQYRNPHETDHTIIEVIEWLEKNDFRFVSSIPAPKLGMTMRAVTQPFREMPRGSKFEIALSQILSLRQFQREGGLFMVIGRRSN
jgi:2-polyprenyl-3-methyl-5-hydroxy-6-metoxy-1,4-benzoquinol methylase